MLKRTLVVFLGGFLLGGPVSCQRLPQPGQLALDTSPFADAIPADYGDPIGVTSVAGDPTWTQVWFLKPDKSIVVVLVNPTRGRLGERVISIPRR